MKPVDQDPIYIGLRDYRKDAEKRVEVDFTDCQLAILYPLPSPPWRVTSDKPEAGPPVLSKGQVENLHIQDKPRKFLPGWQPVRK